jgi:rhamnogalacturonan acetylesterase
VEDAAKMGLQTKAKAGLPTLWLVGDSTMKVGTAGQRGWGEELAPFFDLSKINVVNRAIGGRSSRTFITEGRWDGIVGEMHPGDFVLIQFGTNDSGVINEDPPVTKSTRARATIKGNGEETVYLEKNILTGKPETVHTYGWYLRKYVSDAKMKGVTPIVCSLIPRKSWSPEGKVNRASGGYGLWAKQAAKQEGALFIDHNEIIARGYETLGQPAVEPLFADKGTHTSPAGAQFNARAAVSGLKALGDKNPLAPFLSADGKAVPAFQP